MDVMQDIQKHPALQDAEYLRLPRPGQRCPMTGLSRTTLCELTLPSPDNNYKPPVRSVVIKKRNAIRGIRLINRASLLDYLRTLEGGGETGHPSHERK